MIMFVVFVRVLAFLLASLVAFAGGLILVGIDKGDKAAALFIVCALVAWIVRPDPEQMAAFDEFQKQRLKKYGIEI